MISKNADFYATMYRCSLDYDIESLFSDLVGELQSEIKQKKLTKMPAALKLISEKNNKWNEINSILQNRSSGTITIEQDGFIKCLKNKVPEIFDGEIQND